MRSLLSTGLPWAMDNGAFSGFDPARFTRKLEQCIGAPRLLFVVCPDVVADARATLALWPWWACLIRSKGLPAAFVLQDGQEDEEMPDADAYFIGGSTDWKLSTASADLAREAKRRGKWLHMGRVNSRRRLQIAAWMGCDSVDGGSCSMFGERYIRKFCLWAKEADEQPCLRNDA